MVENVMFLPSLQADHLQEVLTMFYVHIDTVLMNYLESRGNLTSEERMDTVCRAVPAGTNLNVKLFEFFSYRITNYGNVSIRGFTTWKQKIQQ